MPHVRPWNTCVGNHTYYNEPKFTAPETQIERRYDLKRTRTTPPRAEVAKTFARFVTPAFARLEPARETVKASIPIMAQLKGSIPSHGPLERLFSGPRSDSVL